MKSAIILAAGKGERLRPYTINVPKVLTEVNGTPILGNTLNNLGCAGVKKVAIVVGYLKEKIVEYCESQEWSVEIEFIVSDKYAVTNNMYSLWLAESYLVKGCILIEGDVFFEADIVTQIAKNNNKNSYWVVDIFGHSMNGCMLTAQDNGRIVSLEIVRENLNVIKANQFKSVGILDLSAEYGSCFLQWVQTAIKQKKTDVYYDLVLREHLHEMPIYTKNIAGMKWFEIDDIEDLHKAEEIFKEND